MDSFLGSLKTTAGYLRDCPIEFVPGLNCIIGARGSCKSTIVETIRFVFDCDPGRVKTMIKPAPQAAEGTVSNRAGLIFETLSGGTARCEIIPTIPTESSVLVERNPEVGPKVLRDGIHQVDATDTLRQIEIYSQGDLQTIAEQPSRRLALIDQPNQKRVDQLNTEKRGIISKLAKLGASIRNRRPEIETRRAKAKDLEIHKTQLAQLEANRPKLPPELESEREAYEERRQTYVKLRTAVQAYERAAVAAQSLMVEVSAVHDASAAVVSIDVDAAKSIVDAMQRLLASTAGIADELARKENLQAYLESVAASFETASARYLELRREQQQINEALRTEDTLRGTVAALQAIQDELLKIQEEHARDIAERSMLRARRDEIADELYAMRLEQIDKINLQFGNHIVLTLQQGALTETHRKLLEELLQRSNLKGQADVARELAERVRPSDLIDIVESGDTGRLATALDRDLGQMTRLVSHLIDAQRLYELESVVPEDGLEITMVVRGEARPLGQLSKGQMATALLPLVLREAECPLIVDQPEDDLDNAFVSEKLIDRVRELSKKRQLIFVTHNANIPVLGNAARVIVMEMDGPRTALPARVGDVDERKDDIIRILEGGKEAFRNRQAKYGTALE